MCMSAVIIIGTKFQFAFIKIHIVCVEECEDFFAIGNDVFTERPLRFLNVEQDQQLKLKGCNGFIGYSKKHLQRRT